MPRNAARKLTNEEECLPINAITSSVLHKDTNRDTATKPTATTKTTTTGTETRSALRTTTATTTATGNPTTYNNNNANKISLNPTEGHTLSKRRAVVISSATKTLTPLSTPSLSPTSSLSSLNSADSPTKIHKDRHIQATVAKAACKKGQPIKSDNNLKASPVTHSTNIAPISHELSNAEDDEIFSTPADTEIGSNTPTPTPSTAASWNGAPSEDSPEKDTEFVETTEAVPVVSGLGLLPSLYPIVIDITSLKAQEAEGAEATTLPTISGISLANLNSTAALVGDHGVSVGFSSSTGASALPKKSPAAPLVKRRRHKRSGRSRNSAKENRRLATLRARRAQEQAKKAEEEEQQQQQKLVQQQQQQQEQQSSSIAKTAVGSLDHLDEAILNKIEVVEDEIKKPTGKRRRVISFPATTTINTRKRTAQRNILGNSADQREAVAAVTPPANKAEVVSNSPAKSSPARKRGRSAMSLSERRYHTDDSGGGGLAVRGGTLNGYISSSRTPTGSGGDNNSDVPEITAHNGNLANISHAPSMATLCNIGNTCYFNSVVYTLRFAPRFLHNLHHLISDVHNVQKQVNVARVRGKTSSLGRGITGVKSVVGDAAPAAGRSWSPKDMPILEQQSSNGLGGGDSAMGDASPSTTLNKFQLVTERLHELYQHLHCNEMSESKEPFHADTLLNAIQDVNSIFEGNQQQDAHEFLMCLLNSLRETSQILLQILREYPEILIYRARQTDDVMDCVGTAVDRDANAPSQTSSSLSLSSLSTSNLTKPSLFLRKSKRKDEAKNSKNSRLQSPLKDSPTGVHSTANSLFYLNALEKASAANTLAELAPPSDTLTLKGGGDALMDVLSSPSAGLSNDELFEVKIRELGLNFFHEDFEGITVSTTKCLSCETITEQKETMIDIAVPVPIAGYDSSDYSDKSGSFIQNSCITREYFRGENKYRCEQCTGYTEAIRSISYEVLPRLLVIQLSRFSGGMEKINSFVPTTFTLQCFCSKCCQLEDANKLHAYKLYSVITHVGATMSVGHYIAYTTALDWAQEYINCPKDRRFVTQAQQQQHQLNNMSNQQQQQQQQQTNTGVSSTNSSSSSAAASLMKKMKLVRSKASSSGDVAKNAKQLNGLTSKAITNGLGKLNMNTTCQSLTCCATRLCNYAHQQQLYQQQQQQQQQQSSQNNTDTNEESQQNGANSMYGMSSSGSFPSGYGSTARAGSYQRIPTPIANGNSNEPIWYMCDDDKIKAMSQREFEDLLSPSRKITVTPYLLFYARTDLQPKQASSGATTITSPSSSQSSKQSAAESGGGGGGIGLGSGGSQKL